MLSRRALLLLAAAATTSASGSPLAAEQIMVQHGVGAGKFPKGTNETYGYPDGVGALIVEGPFPYKRGPETWSPKTPNGAYALISIPGSTVGGSAKCTPIPADSPFFGSTAVRPVALTNGANNTCMLGCDTAAVTRTGRDPCNLGTVRQPTNSIMSCWDVGPGFAGGSGVCGYNCSAFEPKLVDGKIHTCDKEDLEKGNCEVFCNSLGFPKD